MCFALFARFCSDQCGSAILPLQATGMTFVLVLLVSNSGRMHCGLVNQARLVQSWCCPIYCMACLLLIPVSDVAQTHLFTAALLQCTSIWSTHTLHLSRLHVRSCNQVCRCCVITLPISELFDSFPVCCQEVSVRLFRARPDGSKQQDELKKDGPKLLGSTPRKNQKAQIWEV